MTGELAKSWNDRLGREQARCIEGLRQRSAGLEMTAPKRRLFDQCTNGPEGVTKLADVEKSATDVQEKYMLLHKMLEPLLEDAAGNKLKETAAEVAEGV